MNYQSSCVTLLYLYTYSIYIFPGKSDEITKVCQLEVLKVRRNNQSLGVIVTWIGVPFQCN